MLFTLAFLPCVSSIGVLGPVGVRETRCCSLQHPSSRASDKVPRLSPARLIWYLDTSPTLVSSLQSWCPIFPSSQPRPTSSSPLSSPVQRRGLVLIPSSVIDLESSVSGPSAYHSCGSLSTRLTTSSLLFGRAINPRLLPS